MVEKGLRYGITGAAFLFNQERAIRVASDIRKEGVDLEVEGLATRVPRVDEDTILSWEDKFGIVPRNWHVEFNYSNREAAGRIFRETGVIQSAYQVLWMGMFDSANNSRTIGLAEKYGSGIIVHPNVLAGMVRNDELRRIQEEGKIPEVFVENERPAGSRELDAFVREENIDIDPRVLMSSPIAIKWAFADRYDLRINFGLDHYQKQQGVGVERVLENVWDRLGRVHISGPSHEVIGEGDEKLEELVSFIVKREELDKVVLVFDYSPTTMWRKSYREQLGVVQESISVVDEVVRRERDKQGQ